MFSAKKNKKDVKNECCDNILHSNSGAPARPYPGQTMTEYALILAAIAVVVYGVYAAMGNNIGSLASGVDSSLTSA